MKELRPPVRANWQNRLTGTQKIGDGWIESAETPLARVPSAILPRMWNVLLNPEHSDAARVKIATVIRERFDNRLFRFGGH